MTRGGVEELMAGRQELQVAGLVHGVLPVLCPGDETARVRSAARRGASCSGSGCSGRRSGTRTRRRRCAATAPGARGEPDGPLGPGRTGGLAHGAGTGDGPQLTVPHGGLTAGNPAHHRLRLGGRAAGPTNGRPIRRRAHHRLPPLSPPCHRSACHRPARPPCHRPARPPCPPGCPGARRLTTGRVRSPSGRRRTGPDPLRRTRSGRRRGPRRRPGRGARGSLPRPCAACRSGGARR